MNQIYLNSKTVTNNLLILVIFLLNLFNFLVQRSEALTATEIKRLASQVVVGISGANQASGVIVTKNGNVYGVLTTKEAIKQEGNNVVVTASGEIHFISDKQSIPQTDLAIVYFESTQTYPLAKAGLLSQPEAGEEFYLAGYSINDNNPKPQYRFYQKELDNNANLTNNDNYQLTYLGAGLEGMSGSAILNSDGRLVGIYSKTEINPDNLQANLLGISINTVDQALQQAGIRLTPTSVNVDLPSTPETQLISKVTNVDYSSLRNLLAAKRWQEADQVTLELMLTSVNRSNEGWFTEEIINDFPCDDVKIIDQLWRKYSDSRFGFQTQKEVYVSSGNSLVSYNANDFKNFASEIGWYQDNQWLPKTNLTYDENAPVGHLPASPSKRLGVYLGLLFSTCQI